MAETTAIETAATIAAADAAAKTTADKATADKAAADAAAAAAGANGHDTDWRATITDPKVKEFAARMTSPADAATTAFNLRQKLSSAIIPPGKDAKPEDIADFHKKLGVPDAPDKYELAATEGQSLDEGFKTKMATAFHAAKVSSEGAKILNQAWNGIVTEQQTARDAALTQAREEATAALRKEWPGKEFDTNVMHAQKAVQAFGGDDLRAWVQETTIDGIKLGDHPRFVKTFAQIGRRMGEDGAHGGMTAEETASAKDEIPKLRADLREAMSKGNQALASSIQTKLDAAYAKAHPGKRDY